MGKSARAIPVNNFGGELKKGVIVEKISSELFPLPGEWTKPERHDLHTFFLLEEGDVSMEIDFQKYEIQAPSVIYLHPNQVHRVKTRRKVLVSTCAINNENLNPEYLKMLEDMLPVAPKSLDQQTFKLLLEVITLCIKLTKRQKGKLYQSLLRGSSNTFIALVLTELIGQAQTPEMPSRTEQIAKIFRETLEQYYIDLKRPTDYANKLNLSTSYLNECMKNATGHSVTYHIHQRIILEAKRLLRYSDWSVKEIAARLGYDDYTYFSRLFRKVAAVSPVAFRHKNLD